MTSGTQLLNQTYTHREENSGRAISWYGAVDQNSSSSDYSDTIKYGIERNHQNFLKMFYMLSWVVISKAEVVS